MKKPATGLLTAAVTGAAALSLTATTASATTASATTASATTASATTGGATTAQPAAATTSDVRYWGPYYAANKMAMARGMIRVITHEGGGTYAAIRVTLRDMDTRSSEQGGQCAYVKIQWSDANGNRRGYRSQYLCGDHATKSYQIGAKDVGTVRVQVCSYNEATKGVTGCDGSHVIYRASPQTSGGSEAAFAAEVIKLTNQAREAAGCARLAQDSRLRAAAQGHSTDMAGKGYFSHTSADGRTPAQRIAAAGYAPVSAWAENIARGQSSPAEVVKTWLESPGHAANIKNCALTHIGVGYDARGSYWTQVFGRH
ncbi:CAP domain-containing protein [Thermoactinospora rubra]|uniref:CAP domain-containing protein n=1 Tax=Thermoactinospora rubra TaxID=1088767 RepID=UPI000A115496|nr:CAP domain-containing protein [Thermoactinospora rubra]